MIRWVFRVIVALCLGVHQADVHGIAIVAVVSGNIAPIMYDL